MAYSFVQSVEGTRVTSGTSMSTTYTTQNVTAGNLLVAIISREAATQQAPTVLQVTDNAGNRWKQATEFSGGTGGFGGKQGVDIWFCESAGGGNKPTVTASVSLAYGPITGMNMQVLEYTGNSGMELVDQPGQIAVSGTTVTVTTANNLNASNDLSLTVVTGNMSAATVPTGYTSRLADTTQQFWVADNVSTGTSGSTLSAQWTGLTGATSGAAIIATFKTAGTTTGPSLLQMSYHLDAFPVSVPFLTRTSQSYPVNPTAGNTLFAFVTGTSQVAQVGGGTGNLLSQRVNSITDTAGNTWVNCGESGVDNTSGVDWTLYMVQSALGGATTLTVTFDRLSQGLACMLLEFSGLPSPLVVDGTVGVNSASTVASRTATTPGSVHAGCLAISMMSVLASVSNTVSSGWTQFLSDSTGVGYGAYQTSVASAGPLTITWSGSAGQGIDILLSALRPAIGAGIH